MARKQDDALRITSAATSQSVDISGRQRRYLIAMGIRTLCFILAVVFIGHWGMWVFLTGAVFLPYFAVIMANSGPPPAQVDSDYAYHPDFKALGE